MTAEQATLLNVLFNALDDTLLNQYNWYLEFGSEYPSDTAIQALKKAEDEGIGISRALKKMNENLADDVTREGDPELGALLKKVQALCVSSKDEPAPLSSFR